MDSVFLFTFSGTFQIFYNEKYYFHNHNRKKGKKNRRKKINLQRGKNPLVISAALVALDCLGNSYPEMKPLLGSYLLQGKS